MKKRIKRKTVWQLEPKWPFIFDRIDSFYAIDKQYARSIKTEKKNVEKGRKKK